MPTPYTARSKTRKTSMCKQQSGHPSQSGMLLAQRILKRPSLLLSPAKIERSLQQPTISGRHHCRAPNRVWQPLLRSQHINDAHKASLVKVKRNWNHFEENSVVGYCTVVWICNTASWKRNPHAHDRGYHYSMLRICQIRLQVLQET